MTADSRGLRVVLPYQTTLAFGPSATGILGAQHDDPGLFAFDAATGKSLGLVAKVPAGAMPFEGIYCGF